MHGKTRENYAQARGFLAGAQEHLVNRLSGMFIAVLAGSVLTVAPALGQNSGSNAESFAGLDNDAE